MKICLPMIRGKGPGLGNILIPWSRSFLMSQVLDATTLIPALGRNDRNYKDHFSTPKFDWFFQKLLSFGFPTYSFRQDDYLTFGGGNVIDSIKEYAAYHKLDDKQHYLITTEGMWGGYYHISEAKDFIKSTLYNTAYAPRNLMKIERRLNSRKITIGMHIRLGDFATYRPELNYKGKFNISLPLDWYYNLANNIYRKLGDNVEFLIVTDGTADQVKMLTDSFPCVLTSDINYSDCSDILALSRTDLIICSISSFSCTATFISDAPYIWFEPNLQLHKDQFYSIWGHEQSQLVDGSATLKSIELAENDKDVNPRGYPVNIKGDVPDRLLEYVITKHNNKFQMQADLIHYGVVDKKFNSFTS